MIYDKVVNKEFKIGHNFEGTHVRKWESHNFAWIVATSPEQKYS